jgi:hypothetical protein
MAAASRSKSSDFRSAAALAHVRDLGANPTGEEILSASRSLQRDALRRTFAEEFDPTRFISGSVVIERRGDPLEISAREACIALFDPSPDRTLREIPKEVLASSLREGVEGKEQMRHFLTYASLPDELLSGMECLPRGFVTAPIMTTAYSFCQNVYPLLSGLFGSDKVVYPQYSTGMHTHKRFADGTEMKGAVYLTEENVRLLQGSPDAPVLLVEQVCETRFTPGVLSHVFRSQLGCTGDFFVMVEQESRAARLEDYLGEKGVPSDPRYRAYLDARIVTERGRTVVGGEFAGPVAGLKDVARKAA